MSPLPLFVARPKPMLHHWACPLGRCLSSCCRRLRRIAAHLTPSSPQRKLLKLITRGSSQVQLQHHYVHVYALPYVLSLLRSSLGDQEAPSTYAARTPSEDPTPSLSTRRRHVPVRNCVGRLCTSRLRRALWQRARSRALRQWIGSSTVYSMFSTVGALHPDNVWLIASSKKGRALLRWRVVQGS
jgi:hypothetical protein